MGGKRAVYGYGIFSLGAGRWGNGFEESKRLPIKPFIRGSRCRVREFLRGDWGAGASDLWEELQGVVGLAPQVQAIG